MLQWYSHYLLVKVVKLLWFDWTLEEGCTVTTVDPNNNDTSRNIGIRYSILLSTLAPKAVNPNHEELEKDDWLVWPEQAKKNTPRHQPNQVNGWYLSNFQPVMHKKFRQ